MCSTSGKRSVISSSPRDQSHTRPARLTSWARMPSYFHSTTHSPGAPNRASQLSCLPSIGCARKNG